MRRKYSNLSFPGSNRTPNRISRFVGLKKQCQAIGSTVYDSPLFRIFCCFFSFSKPKSPSKAVNFSVYAWRCKILRPFGIRVTSMSVILPLDSAQVCTNVTLSLKIGFKIVFFISSPPFLLVPVLLSEQPASPAQNTGTAAIRSWSCAKPSEESGFRDDAVHQQDCRSRGGQVRAASSRLCE